MYGSINNELFEKASLNYNFSIDNNFETFDSHSLGLNFEINNFITEFNYEEQKGDIGSNHSLSTNIAYNFDENNHFHFRQDEIKKLT